MYITKQKRYLKIWLCSKWLFRPRKWKIPGDDEKSRNESLKVLPIWFPDTILMEILKACMVILFGIKNDTYEPMLDAWTCSRAEKSLKNTKLKSGWNKFWNFLRTDIGKPLKQPAKPDFHEKWIMHSRLIVKVSFWEHWRFFILWFSIPWHLRIFRTRI